MMCFVVLLVLFGISITLAIGSYGMACWYSPKHGYHSSDMYLWLHAVAILLLSLSVAAGIAAAQRGFDLDKLHQEQSVGIAQ